MMGTIVYAALTILMANLVFGVVLWLRVRKLYSYPNVLGFPVIGNLYYFYRTLLFFTIDRGMKYIIPVAEEHGKDGLFFHWLFGSSVAAIITCPHLVKKLSFHPNLADKPHAAYIGFQLCLEGPFSALRSDNVWKQRRKDFSNYLKKSRVENDYYKIFIKCSDRMVNIMLESSSGVDSNALCAAVAHDVALKSMFSIETSLVYHPEIVALLTRIKEVASILTLNSPIISPLFRILQPLADIMFGKLVELRKLILGEIDNQLKSNQQPLQEELPLSINMILRIRRDNESEKRMFKQLHEVFLTSGHTVGTKLANVISLLGVLPDIQERAWQEQDEIFGNDIRDPTIADLNQMKFLDRFLKECYRFLGPPFLAKMATADINVDGITIPRGTLVIYLLRFIKLHPKYWRNPNIFDPDRFLDEDDYLKCSYTPFGIGVRSCPGEYFATMFMKITLSKILRRLKLRPVEKDFRFEDIKFKSFLLLEVENSPMLEVEERI